MSWRDNQTPDRTGVSLGKLADGESATFKFLDDGQEKQTENGECVVFGVIPVEFPDGYQTMNGGDVETGEEYDLYSSSSRFLFRVSEFADDMTDQKVSITAHGDKDSFDRTYDVNEA